MRSWDRNIHSFNAERNERRLKDQVNSGERVEWKPGGVGLTEVYTKAALYEAHITSQVSDHELEQYKKVCSSIGLKPLEIDLINKQGGFFQERMCTATYKAPDLKRAIKRCKELSERLAKSGFPDTRQKLETTPWNKIVLRQTEEDVKLCEKAYLECHLKLIFRDIASLSDVEKKHIFTRVGADGWHISRVNKKTILKSVQSSRNGPDVSIPFEVYSATKRHYDVSLEGIKLFKRGIQNSIDKFAPETITRFAGTIYDRDNWGPRTVVSPNWMGTKYALLPSLDDSPGDIPKEAIIEVAIWDTNVSGDAAWFN